MTPTELSEAAGISLSHATKIMSGERKPSLTVAFAIYDTTGLQFGILTGLDSATIERIRAEQRAAA